MVLRSTCLLLSISYVLWSIECQHIESQQHILNLTNIRKPSNDLQPIPKEISVARQSYLASSSILYGLLRKLNESYVNEICNEHLQMVYNGINQKKVWAMKVLDSSAQIEPGFIFGNNFWLGSIKECEGLKEQHTVTISKRFHRNMKPGLIDTVAPFDLEYMIVHAKHDSPWQIQAEFLLTRKILQIGLCLPQSCGSNDVFNLTQNYFDEESIGFTSEYEFQPEVLRVKNLKIETNFFKKMSVQLIGAFLLLTLLLTTSSNICSNISTKICQNDSDNSNCDTMDNNNNNDNSDDLIKPKQKDLSVTTSLMKCFSIKDNFEFIMSVDSAPNSLPTINGLKSIGCFLILIFHMNWFSHFSIHNPVMMFAYGEKPMYQWVSTTPLIVDMFFTVSGLLLSYNFLKNQRNIWLIQHNTLWQNFVFFIKQVLHRYLRLTPLYLFVIGVTEISTAYLHETSAFWIEDRNDLTCQNYWWRNLLYIQNLYPIKDLCLNWTWSMACEMQFFIIFTFLLFIYAKYPELTKKTFVSLFVGFTVIIYSIAYKTKFEPAYDVMHELGDDMYTSPLSRILPYLIGVGTGWFLLNCKHTLNIDKKSTNYMCLVAISIIVAIIVACHCAALNRALSYKYASPLITLIRVFYSFSTAWIIVSSTTDSGNGTILAKLLNHKIFIHLNKLSYGIYLLNPVVICLVYGLIDHSTHIDPITMSIMSVGISVIVYLLAIVCSLLFEVPYTKISVLFKNRKNKVL